MLPGMAARKLPPLSEILRDPRLALMLALGFSSGLPFLLIFSTQSAWLREAGVSRSRDRADELLRARLHLQIRLGAVHRPLRPAAVGRLARAPARLDAVGADRRRGRARRASPSARRRRSLVLEHRLRLPHRLRRRDAGRDDRRLAHRRRAARAAGHDDRGLQPRLSRSRCCARAPARSTSPISRAGSAAYLDDGRR